MITERSSILSDKTSAGAARGSLLKKISWLWIVLLVIGAALLIGYIAASTVYEELNGKAPWWGDLLLFGGAIPFAIGLIFTLATRSQLKADRKTEQIITHCEFFSDCFILREFKEEEQVGVLRIDYKNVLRSKQRGEYIYVYIAQAVAYPVWVKSLSDSELFTVKKLLKIPVKGEGGEVELKPCDLIN